MAWASCKTLRWRHNGHDSDSNHQPHGCLLNRLLRRRSRKTSKLRITGLCVRNSPWPVNSPHKWPVTRKMFPFDEVIMTRWETFKFWDLVHLISEIWWQVRKLDYRHYLKILEWLFWDDQTRFTFYGLIHPNSSEWNLNFKFSKAYICK